MNFEGVRPDKNDLIMALKDPVVMDVYSTLITVTNISRKTTNTDLVVVRVKKSPGFIKVNRIHPLSTTDIGTKFPVNPTNSCNNISLKAKSVKVVVLERKKKSQGIATVSKIHPQ